MKILDIGIGKAEGILANQREEQRRREGKRKKREGQRRWERRTAGERGMGGCKEESGGGERRGCE